MRLSSQLPLLVPVFTLPLLIGCSDDPVTPITAASLAGTSNATTFTVTPPGQALINVLSAGGSLTITLNADGSTTGTLFVPAAASGSGDVTASMVGTFTISGSTVEFTQADDTFVRDMTFTVSGNTLSGNETFSGAVVVVVLTRS